MVADGLGKRILGTIYPFPEFWAPSLRKDFLAISPHFIFGYCDAFPKAFWIFSKSLKPFTQQSLIHRSLFPFDLFFLNFTLKKSFEIQPHSDIRFRKPLIASTCTKLVVLQSLILSFNYLSFLKSQKVAQPLISKLFHHSLIRAMKCLSSSHIVSKLKGESPHLRLLQLRRMGQWSEVSFGRAI